VLIHKSFRYRVYPTPAQVERIVAWEHSLRSLWNIAQEQRLLGMARSKDERRYYTAFDQINQLKELRAELPWLADVPSDVCGQLLVELDMAWERCFKKLARAPRWKHKGKGFLSLCETHSNKWRLDGDVIRFPKLGNLRAVIHRPLEGTPKACTLKRDGDQWFATISCVLDVPEPAPRTEPIVAIDRGVVVFGARSDGKPPIENPEYLLASMKRLVHADRTVSRRKKGSQNQKKARLHVMRIHRLVRRQREYHLHVQSARLAKSHGVVVLEKLNVAGMMRGNCARGIADAGWSAFSRMLEYKQAWSGGSVEFVNAAYSSQTCSECGCVDRKSRRSQSEFVCTACGHAENADVNAAKVLLKRRVNPSALPVEGSLLEGTLRSRKSLRVSRRSAESSALQGRVDYGKS